MMLRKSNIYKKKPKFIIERTRIEQEREDEESDPILTSRTGRERLGDTHTQCGGVKNGIGRV
jgi:hypothetical protein